VTTQSRAGRSEKFALRTVLETTLAFRLWVAFAVASLAFYGGRVAHPGESGQGAEPGRALTVWGAVFLSTFALYNLDGCLEGNSDALRKRPGRRIQLTISLLAVAALAMLLPFLHAPGAALVVSGFLVCSLYALPLGLRSSVRKPLKTIPGVKAPFIGFAVAIAAVWVPLLSSLKEWPSGDDLIHGSPFRSAILLSFTLGLLCTVNALLFDVPDVLEDKARGVPTVVLRWGIAGNRRLCLLLCLLASGVAALTLTHPLPLLLLTCALAVATVLINHKTPKTLIAFWVDGALTLPALALLLDT
jgi:4-hydroxybenzoate polyprenyltransferase